MKNKILNAVWASPKKDRIICLYEYLLEKGKTERREASVFKDPTTDSNPEWDIIIDQFGEDAISANTELIELRQRELREKTYAAEKESIEQEKTERLFECKLALFEIPEIKESKNRALKSRIRKASNIYEAQMLASILFLQETNESQ